MNKKLALINRNTLESLEETEVGGIIERFTKTGMEVLGADFGFMFWKLENQDTYQLIYQSPETPYEPKLPRKRGYNYKASAGRIPYFVTEPKKDISAYMKSLAIIPIFYKNYQYGNIILCFKNKRKFGADDVSLAVTLSNIAAQVLTIYRNHKKTEREALRTIKQKDEFFNIVSHELKTPVTTIKGFSQLLLRKLSINNDSETKYFLEKINHQVNKITRLINDLLDISRIETGKLAFRDQNFDLERVIYQGLESLKVVIRSHSLVYNHGFNRHWVRGDSERIEEVLINLITNAAKYSPPGSKIKICIKEKAGQVRVEVEDFGYGIKKKDRLKVFNRFFQSKNSANENPPGLGLGLYIANSIVKAHGGSMDFKSKVRSPGTVFAFNLPYSRREVVPLKQPIKTKSHA